MEFFNYISEFNTVSIILRLVLAMIFGSFFGLDRSRKGSPAGLKTHSLVCVGSCLIMITSEFAVIKTGSGDVQRMAAQVVSGIGFLGAGTILVTGKNKIKGLTSAAGIWFSASVGLALGIGFYLGAVIGLVLEFFIVHVLAKAAPHKKEQIIDVYLEFENDFKIIDLINSIKIHNCHITGQDIEKFTTVTLKNHVNSAVFSIEASNNTSIKKLLTSIIDTKGVSNASDI